MANNIEINPVSDTPFDAATWDGVTTIAPSKNAVRDQLVALDTSVAATYVARGERYFDPVDYGAVGDGATDDTAAFLLARDAANAVGGTVVVRPRTFIVGALGAPSRVRWEGVGRGSVLKLKDGTNASMFTLTADTVGEVQIVNMTLEGNKANQTGTSHGVFFTNTTDATAQAAASAIGLHDPQHVLSNLLIKDFLGDGVRLIGRGDGRITNVHVWRCDGRGFHIGAPDYAMLGVEAGNCGRQGFFFARDVGAGEGSGSATRVFGAKAWYSGRVTPSEGNGFEINAYQVVIHGEAQDNQKHGFALSACEDAFVVGTADTNSNDGTNADSGEAGSGFFFYNARYCKVVGNAVDRVTGLQKYAVEFGAIASVECDVDVVGRNNVNGDVGGTVGDNWVRRMDPLNTRGGRATCALQHAGTIQAWGATNEARYIRVVTGGRISKIGVHVGTSSGNVSVAVYRRSGVGAAAVPGTRLATSGAVACPATGYQEISLGSTVTVLPGDYLAMSCDNTTATFLGTSGAAGDIYAGQSATESSAHPLGASPTVTATGYRLPTLIGVP